MIWTEESKKSLAAMLANPDFSLHFRVQTDVSDKRLGAVLSQIDNKGQKCAVHAVSQEETTFM